LARLAGANLVRGILFRLTSRTPNARRSPRIGARLVCMALQWDDRVLYSAMSKRMKVFLMQYVRRALLLIADGIKVLCSEEDESES
jgi:hypothetical protein